MPGSSDPDLAAMKARYELNYHLVDRDPKLASNPLVIAALARAKASEAAFYAATKDVEAQPNFFRRWNSFRRFRQAAIAAEKAHDELRAMVKKAGERANHA